MCYACEDGKRRVGRIVEESESDVPHRLCYVCPDCLLEYVASGEITVTPIGIDVGGAPTPKWPGGPMEQPQVLMVETQ